MFYLSTLRKISDDGVTFRSHLDGTTHTDDPGALHKGAGGSRQLIWHVL